jgi:hypothetical protein
MGLPKAYNLISSDQGYLYIEIRAKHSRLSWMRILLSVQKTFSLQNVSGPGGARTYLAASSLSRLLNLKLAKDRKGVAPNKPLLVLAILDLVEAGLVGMDGLVHKDAQLNLRFRS